MSKMPATPLELGEWLPDLPPVENPGALEAKNVIPLITSYSQLRDLAPFTNALASACLGAIWFQGSDNTIYNFAGDISALYSLTGGNTWNNVSKAGGYTNVTNWQFVKFGDRAIALARGENPQYFDAGSSSLFADLPGSPPVAARGAVVRDFVVLGDLEAFGPNFVAWSGFNNSELWTPSKATQSDRQELFGRGGRVQAVVPGEYGVIVQEHSIHRMDYVGPPVIFQFDEVERGRGTPAANSVAWTGNLVFYYGHDGFYLFNGQSSEPIGSNRVNDWFRDNADTSALSSMRAVVDRQNGIVLWAFRSSGSLNYNDRLLIYRWTANRWAWAEVDTQVLAEFVSSGFTLDQLDGPLPQGIDLDSIAVDSDAFKGGALSTQAFDSSNRSATFSGTPLQAIIDTTEYRSPDGRRVYVNSVRPLVDGDPSTVVQISKCGRNSLTDNAVFDLPRPLNPHNGEASLRNDKRYHRYRLTIDGGFRHATGVELRQKARGSR